ncbi:MAG: hypothetical protein JNJ83_03990 [Verrucomicrobiaceae bacterium]|nr:hypothetical protein [Verrucomicrobiaceae bacterium]
MHRLRCGVIYTNAFAEYLAQLERSRPQARTIIALDYVRCTAGQNQAKEWWKVEWMPEHRAPDDCRFTIGNTPVCLSRQSQRGLKHRCIDWRDGQVVVKS